MKETVVVPIKVESYQKLPKNWKFVGTQTINLVDEYGGGYEQLVVLVSYQMPNSSEGFDLYWFGLTNSLISRDGELTKVSIDGDATILDTNWFYSSGDEDFHAVYCVLADEEEDC